MLIYKIYYDRENNCHRINIVDARKKEAGVRIRHDVNVALEYGDIDNKGIIDVNRVAVVIYQTLNRNSIRPDQKVAFVFSDVPLTEESRTAAKRIVHMLGQGVPVDIRSVPDSTILAKSDIDDLVECYETSSIFDRMKDMFG